MITDTISEENIKTKQVLEKLQPVVDFVNSFDVPENLKTILEFFRDDYLDSYPDEKFRPLEGEFTPYVSKKLEEIAKTMGMTKREAFEMLMKENLKTMEDAEKMFQKIEEDARAKHRKKTGRRRKTITSASPES